MYYGARVRPVADESGTRKVLRLVCWLFRFVLLLLLLFVYIMWKWRNFEKVVNGPAGATFDIIYFVSRRKGLDVLWKFFLDFEKWLV